MAEERLRVKESMASQSFSLKIVSFRCETFYWIIFLEQIFMLRFIALVDFLELSCAMINEITTLFNNNCFKLGQVDLVGLLTWQLFWGYLMPTLE